MYKKLTKITILLLISILALCSCSFSVPPVPTLPSDGIYSDTNGTFYNMQNLSTNFPSISQIVKKVSPSVVGINVIYDDKSNDATGSLGSGVVVDKDGYIITNHHVIGKAGTIEAVFVDGNILTAQLLWSDKNLDLAIIKVEGEFIPIKMGNSEKMEVGDTVIAIGTPLAMKFQHTVTSGIVSGKNRTLTVPSEDGISFMEDLIQTDASINPGNSGGPLINLRGEVIGINTLKVTEAEGLGFAIPIDICVPIVANVIKDPNYATPYLGIMAMDSQIASYLGKELDKGIMVMAIDNTSPAYEAGIREGCVILEIDSIPINSVFSLRKYIYALGANSTIEIKYIKDDKEYIATCTLTTS